MDSKPGKRQENKHSGEWKGRIKFPTVQRHLVQPSITGKARPPDQLCISSRPSVAMLSQSHMRPLLALTQRAGLWVQPISLLC